MRNISFVNIDLCWYMSNWKHHLIQNILICGLKAKTQLLVCNKMHQQNRNEQQIRQANCTRHPEWLELPVSCGNWSCSTQDLSETRSLQKNETARQKSVHDYVVNTLNSSARVYEWTFLYDSDPRQEHMSVHVRFCSAQTQDFSHCINTLDHRETLLTCFLQSRLDAKNPWQSAIRIPLVKAEVALPDRKHAKLWSGMRHEEYADEAPLLKAVI